MALYRTVSGPAWSDRPVAIVAGGPSLAGFDFERLRGLHVLAIKGSIFDIPWADAGFGMDFPRFVEWQEKLAAIQMRVYWAVPDDKIARCPHIENVTYLKRHDGSTISDDPGLIYSGGTSGFGGMQIALLKRARTIGLFGFDYNGNFGYFPAKFRHNDRHYGKRRMQEASNWATWAGYFAKIKPMLDQRGIEVINACPSSSITAFRKTSIDEAVDHLQKVAA